MQQPSMAAQTCLKKKDVMTGVSLMFFAQGLGGAIWTSVAQTIFSHGLVNNFSKIANISATQIVNTGATQLRNVVPAAMLPLALEAYNGALMNTLRLGLGLAAAGIFGGIFMEWKSLKNKSEGGTEDNKTRKTEEETLKSQKEDGTLTDNETSVPSRTSAEGTLVAPEKVH